MKKFYTLLTALAATVAMNAAETYTVQCYPVDYSGSTPVTTETPVSQTIVVDGRNVTFPDILGAEGVSPTFSIPEDPANGTYTCDISNWKSGSYNLGTIGTGTKCYFEKTCNNYTTVKYYPSTNTFEFYAYFYGIIEGDYETYGFICVMPDGFLAEASQENNATGYIVGSDNQWGSEFTFTQTYTINGGVVTLTNFLGSSQNVEITAYDNGKAKQTGGLDGYISDTYTYGDLTLDRVYFDKGDYFYCEYDTEENKIWCEGYAYAGETYYYIGFYVALPDSFTPEEAPAAAAAAGSTKVLLSGVDTEFSTGVSYKDGVLTLPNFLDGGEEISYTITEDEDGIKTATANFNTCYISINAVAGSDTYYSIYQYGADYNGQYNKYVQAEDGNDYIQMSGYLYKQNGTYAYAADAIKIFMPSETALIRDELIGEYTGKTKGYEYITTGDHSLNTIPETVFDGVNNAYVKIEVGEAEDEVIVSNLIPTGLSFIYEQGGPVTGVVATSDVDGYIASITIQPADYGKVTYMYGTTPYTLPVRLGAAWSDAYLSSPSDPVVLMVLDDYTIQSSWTGQGLYLDWYGDQSYWYYSLYTGCGEDILSKVEDGAGVKAITVAEDNTEAPVQFYNLNGVRVNGDNLTPGLYIRRQGTKATKVIVR